MNISQSQINLYRFCPYAYKLHYQDKQEGITFDPSVFEVGRRVHDSIDAYYGNHYHSNVVEQEVLYKVYNILRNDWDTTLPASYLKKAYQCLQNFAKFEINNIKEGITTKPLTEVKIPSNGLYGIVDYIDLTKPKVVDFKTNSYASVGYDNKMQATMYKILVKNRFNLKLDEFTFEFLYPGNTKTVRFAGKEFEEIEKELHSIKDKIQESWISSNFPKEPKTERTCNSCEYRYYCSKDV